DGIFLDACGREAVLRRAVRLEREDHALLDLHRIVERHEAADDRPLVERDAETVSELQAEALHLAREAELLRFRPLLRDLVGADAGLDRIDRRIDPFAG